MSTSISLGFIAACALCWLGCTGVEPRQSGESSQTETDTLTPATSRGGMQVVLKLRSETVPAKPIIETMQKKAHFKPLEVHFKVDTTGRVSNCKLERSGPMGENARLISSAEENLLCTALEERRYEPLTQAVEVSVGIGAPQLR